MEDWSSLLVTERHARIRAGLEASRGKSGVFLEPDIPARKLTNARASTQIPASERVFGLIDCTVFGSARNVVVFGEDALYYHNSWTVASQQHRGRAQLDYDRFATLAFTKGNLEVQFPGGTIETAGSGLSSDQMIELLTKLQRSIAHGLGDDPRKPLDGFYISPHLVDRESLDASNEQWPCGIATHADASVIVPPLEHRWGIEVQGSVAHTPAIARDFVIVAVRQSRVFFDRPTIRLVGLELTSGREFWHRDLPHVHWSRPVATHGLVFLKGGAYWHAFDIECGEPRDIDVPALPRAVRDQLVLADATIATPAAYATFAAELAYPESVDAPPLLAANRGRRVYAFPGEQERAPSLRFVDARGVHHLHADRRGELLAFAMTERHLFAGTRDRQLHIADAAAERPAWVSKMELPISVEYLAVGSDHVVIAGSGSLRCYRGS